MKRELLLVDAQLEPRARLHLHGDDVCVELKLEEVGAVQDVLDLVAERTRVRAVQRQREGGCAPRRHNLNTVCTAVGVHAKVRCAPWLCKAAACPLKRCA